MGRSARQLKILDIIGKHSVGTQEQLVEMLRSDGFAVTQATVSRDIKDMNLVKVPAENGKGYRYLVSTPKDNSSDRFINVFKNTVVSIRVAENLVVVKTETGGAGGGRTYRQIEYGLHSRRHSRGQHHFCRR